MTLPNTNITVTRLRFVRERMEIAPLLARHPLAHPERITAIEATQMDGNEARVTIVYPDGKRALGTVTFKEGDWQISIARYVVATNSLDHDALDDDLPLAALEPLIGEIGRGVLEPEWLDD